MRRGCLSISELEYPALVFSTAVLEEYAELSSKTRPVQQTHISVKMNRLENAQGERTIYNVIADADSHLLRVPDYPGRMSRSHSES